MAQERNIPSFLSIFNNALLGPFQVFDIGGEGDPDSRVHVDVLLVRDVLLVHHICLHPPLIVLPFQNVVESFLEVFAVASQVGPLALTEEQQLTLMGF